MCSVVGYIGNKKCKSYILEGLKKLEYRGYDSAGFACIDTNSKQLIYAKVPGELGNLITQCSTALGNGYSGIGHTRWATHGLADDLNAHPHFDCSQKIALVHNGIIENFNTIKQELINEGHIFRSQTDTEVIVHLIEHYASQFSLKDALVKVTQKLEGAYAFIVLFEEYPDTMIAVRKQSPLCVGVKDQELFIASDLLAFSDYTDQVFFMPDKSFALVSSKGLELYDFTGAIISLDAESYVDYSKEAPSAFSVLDKNKFEHFMLREIYEQKSVIKKITKEYDLYSGELLYKQLGLTREYLSSLEHIYLVGCGTSFNSANIMRFAFEALCSVPVTVLLASECRHEPFFGASNSLAIIITQSGETADTLEALRFIKSHNIPILALTNVSTSSAVRESHGFLLLYAGVEVAVASTKAFTAQLGSLYLLAHIIALEKKLIAEIELKKAYRDLICAADMLESCLENNRLMIENEIALLHSKYSHAIFLGRHISYPLAQEAALKLKEISYIFTDCYPAGELKHGSIALVDSQTPVFIFSTPNNLIYKKLLSNAQEVKARGGIIVAFAFEDQDELIELADTAFVFPWVDEFLAPLVVAGVMQFYAYSVARALGRSIDKPRNLAKSVTVE